MNETLDQKLATLKLGRIRQVYTSWVEQAVHSELGYAEFLDQLLTEELLARQENQLRRKMKAAGFPYAATIEQFDFSVRPELKRAVLMRFFDSSFITTAKFSAPDWTKRLRENPSFSGSGDKDGAVGLQRAVRRGATTCQRGNDRHNTSRADSSHRLTHHL